MGHVVSGRFQLVLQQLVLKCGARAPVLVQDAAVAVRFTEQQVPTFLQLFLLRLAVHTLCAQAALYAALRFGVHMTKGEQLL